MKVEYELEIKSIDELLILEINHRVSKAVKSLHSANGLTSAQFKELEADKNSLEKLEVFIGAQALVNNLKEKIDFILEQK